jgi:hypothetical protein
MSTCAATTKTGAPCRGSAADGRDFCALHDPAHAAAQASGRRDGAATRGRQLRAGKSAPALIEFELELDDNGVPLANLDSIENAQRSVTVGLLEGRLSSRDAIARTRVLDSLGRAVVAAARAEERARRSRGWR